LHALLDERDRLFRDLHDHVLQALYAIGLELEQWQRKSPPDVALGLSRVGRRLNRVIRDVRHYIAGSSGPAVDPVQFRAELASLVKAIAPHAAARFELHVSARAVNRLSPPEARHLLHIAREALSNALRHSHAKSGRLALRATRSAVRLEVQDDGIGFDPERPERDTGGLRNMTSRAREIGASLEIASSPAGGTTVVLNVPKENKARMDEDSHGG
jgi:signal transduction histidine kinase